MDSVNKGTKVIITHRMILEWDRQEKERCKTQKFKYAFKFNLEFDSCKCFTY